MAKTKNAPRVPLRAAFKHASQIINLGPDDARPAELKRAIEHFLPGITVDGIPGEVIGNWVSSAYVVAQFRSQDPEVDPSVKQAWAEVTHDLELGLRDALLRVLTREQAIDLLTQDAICLRIGRHLPSDPSLASTIVRDSIRVQTNREQGGKSAGKRYAKHWEQIERAVLAASKNGKPSGNQIKLIIAGCIAMPNFGFDKHNKILQSEVKAQAEISRWMKHSIPAKSGTGVVYSYGDGVSAAKRGK